MWALVIDGKIDTRSFVAEQPGEEWIEVPDDTPPDAVSDGNGGWTAPPPAPPVPDPVAERAERKAEIAEMIANGQTADALNALMALLAG